MINPALLNLDGSFDLPAFLLGEVYGPIQGDGQHISWSLADSLSLADDLLREWGEGLGIAGYMSEVEDAQDDGNGQAVVRAVAEEALFAYRDAVLGAVHEVQRDWTDLAAERARADNLAAAVRADEEALEAALALYRAGKGDYTTVLVRRTALLSASLALAQHRASLADLSISLFKALGGAPAE